MEIIVNGETRTVTQTEVTYEDIVDLAGHKGYPTVVYQGPRKGDAHRSGTLHMGSKPVRLESGMVFSVTHTGNA